VSHPRIAVFARSANGNPDPVRSIEGESTNIARAMHGIVYDEVHDEVVVTNPFAEAILFFRGSANGEEPPIRVIQGPSTMLNGSPVWTTPDALAVDPVHHEVFVPNHPSGSILVFPRTGNGDVAPIRVLRGPKTQLDTGRRVAVDPINNLLVVTARAGILIFNRTDEGDVAPKAIITGGSSGITGTGGGSVAVDPASRNIFVAGRGRNANGYIAVWGYDANGETAPKAVIRGEATEMIWPRGITVNPRDKEIYIVDMLRNALVTYSLPQVF
jgi:DNA-binding beta-propeller fold protein YncE